MITKCTTTELSESALMHMPAMIVFTEQLETVQKIPIDGPYQPASYYELIPPMETDAEIKKGETHIHIRAVVYINSSHTITSLSVFKKFDPKYPEKIDLIIEFEKQINQPTTKFIPYLVKFKIEDIPSLKATNIYLKSSNPRTSRGTVTTVKRPM